MTLDTETYNGLIGKLKKIAIYDGKNIIYGDSFLDVEGHMNELAKLYDVHCYIHNLEFDARKIPQLFEDNRIIWKDSFCINSKIATIKTKHYTLHDSFKILPMSLKALSKSFNVKHGKLDLWKEVQNRYPGDYKDIVDFLDRCPKNDPLFIEYLGYDVLSLYEVLEKLMEVSGLSKDEFVGRISTASLSRFLFKNGYKGHQFKHDGKKDYEIMTDYKWYDNLDVEAILRNAYCGGRTEVFTPILKDEGYHYDVNSLYPDVMKNELYPVGEPKEVNNPILIKSYFENWLQNHDGLGFIQCVVNIPVQSIPPLPCKMGKLAFPCGTVCGTWTYPELEYAINECGVEILEWQIGVHFFKTYPVFRDFIDTMYSIKEEGTRTNNIALRTFGKLIQNCGYGYTGMRRDDKSGYDSIENMDKYPVVLEVNRKLGYIEVPTDIKAEYIQVQIAAYVTSYARLKLLKTLKMAEKTATVFYCDTDSIVTDKPLPDNIVDSKELGKWALESQPKKAIFLKPKVYAEVLDVIENDTVKEKTFVKFKGVSRSTQESFDFETYENLLNIMKEGEKEYVTVEKEKLMQPSLMVLQKQEKSLDYHEYRDKKFFMDNVEKRNIDYVKNSSTPHYFGTLKEFEDFRFTKASRGVDFEEIFDRKEKN